MGSDRKKWTVAAGCVLVAAVALWLTVFSASDEDRIKKQLVRVARTVDVKQDENPLARLGRIQSELRDVVDDDVAVDVRELGLRITGRKKLAENAAQIAAVHSSASAELTSVTVKIDPSGTSAKADARAVVTGVRGGEHRSDTRDVHFLLRKDGGWRITSIDVLPKDDGGSP